MISSDQVIQLYRSYNDAMASDDTEKLREILSSSFTLTHMTGYVEPLNDWLTQMNNGEMHYFNSKEESVEITNISDQEATLVGRNIVTAALYNGSKNDWQLKSVVKMSQSKNGKLLIDRVVVTQY